MGLVRVWVLLCTCLVAVGLSSFTGFNPVLNPAPKMDAVLEEQVLQIIRNHPEAIIESVQAYQQEQQEASRQARLELSRQMQANPAAAIGRSPTTGAAEQALVLLEFADFQCPYCAKAHKRVDDLMAEHPEITFVYKHFPLTSIHEQAEASAEAAWAAQQQGRFWAYYDGLYAHQRQLGEDLYVSLAENLDLDLERFDRDRHSNAAERAIAADVAQAEALEITGTPFFILNGQALSPALRSEEIEAALADVS